MSIARRSVLVALGGAAAGAAGALGGVRVVDDAHDRVPLPFYGTSVSAIRPDESAPSATSGSVVWAAEAGGRRRLALTFDDGPDPEWTPRVLASLAKHRAPATFFLRGDHLERYPQVHAQPSPHEYANHTWDHPDLGRLPYAAVVDQLARTSARIEALLGRRPTLFRPPYGHVGGSTMLAAAEAGLTTVLWSSQMREDLSAAHPETIVANIRGQVRPGHIVLAHDSGSSDRAIT
ncbi:MAG: polysaccharide deacetylase family protein, partial [Lapillicoccus sp.]